MYNKRVKKKIVFLIIPIICITLIGFFIYRNFLGPANPKLHTIRIEKEKKLTDIYRYKCEKIVFIYGKYKNDKVQSFCDNVKYKEYCESFDVIMLFIDKNRNATAYPLYVYYDDLEREPFFDKIVFEVPFEQEIPEEKVSVKRLTKNSFCIGFLYE